MCWTRDRRRSGCRPSASASTTQFSVRVLGATPQSSMRCATLIEYLIESIENKDSFNW
jgi:hypothetical protein